MMTKYIVKTTFITYKHVEAKSREQAKELALYQDVTQDSLNHESEEYVEVERDYQNEEEEED